ncbi:MAG TPA: cyclopropane-fatty-acyl-phospholipid synthase family protein, partial [Candidatus Acidoferrum sp.]|nr:cyclopropane-fatty-acyl-phospholipid synthase family protein [Candidatus Acidoferrum sp.]
EVAQDNKKLHLAAKLLLKPGQKVLDIGSGWGGLGLYLARLAGIDVTGVTLSVEQQKVAQARARAAGLADKVRFHLRDYRHETGKYDRIVSVGMFEHVGAAHYREFFAKVRDLLTDDGVMLLHAIGRMTPPAGTNPWLRKYIFPGGYTPALSEVLSAVEKVGLWVTDIEVLRLHYASTLREWRRRFEGNRDRIRALYDERFCRMWEFYLAGCEIAFLHLGQMVFQMQLSRRLETVPLTRDYIAEFERHHAGRALSAAE